MTNRRLLLFAAMGAAVIVGLAGFGDFKETARRLADFPVSHLAAALALATLNFALRLVRWDWYLKALEIRIPASASALVFLSGLAMSVTPGKLGEAAKCLMLQERWGIEFRRSLPVVLMERLMDLAAVVLLALTGVSLLPSWMLPVLGGLLLATALVLLVIVFKGGGKLTGLPVLRRWREELSESQEAFRQLALPAPAAAGLILGLAAWFSEGAAMWVVLQGLDAPVDLHRAVSIYAAATLIGAATALPGGIGGTEGSMLALLLQSGVSRGAASASTLVVRLTTLWFAVAVGAVAWVLIIRTSRPLQSRGSGAGGPEAGTET